MVVIITGPSHAGKTLLAQKLLEKKHYPYLSIDHLKMGLIRSGNTDLTPLDDDKLTDYLWPIVREIIKTAIENEQNIIVEGCYIPFDWRKDFGQDYLADIRFICLAFSEAYLDSHYNDIILHSSEIESRLDDSYFTAETMKEDNKRYIIGFENEGEKVSYIDGIYNDAVSIIIDSV